MDKLRFDFVVKAAGDGKTNVIALTSIGTQEDRNFIMPLEYQAMNLHTMLEKTKAYGRIKNTLKKRHQKRGVWIALTEDLRETYLDEEENLMFNEYYLEEVERETLEKKDTEVTEDSMTKLLEKLINQQQNYERQNLQKISEKFVLEKYSTKSANAHQWIQDFENECRRFEIIQDRKKIEIFKLFLEKPCLDWYSSMMIKLTIDSEWEKWRKSFIETYANKGWSQIRYAMSFRYQTGSLLEYAVKKQRLLLEVRKTIDTSTLIDLIAVGLPNFIADRIDRESLQETEDLFNEIGKLEHMTEKRKFGEKKIMTRMENKGTRIPCKICEKNNKGARYHPETLCWFKPKNNEEKKNEKIEFVNNSELENVLIKENPKN